MARQPPYITRLRKRTVNNTNTLKIIDITNIGVLGEYCLSNHPIRWLDMIASGLKTHDLWTTDRVNKSDLSVGKRIVLYDGDYRIVVSIASIQLFDSVAEAYEVLGKRLVPILTANTDTVKDYYRPLLGSVTVPVAAVEYRVVEIIMDSKV